jgi:hypothetical protein
MAKITDVDATLSPNEHDRELRRAIVAATVRHHDRMVRNKIDAKRVEGRDQRVARSALLSSGITAIALVASRPLSPH